MDTKQVYAIKAPNLSCPHGFSTRLGGVSAGPLESLNLGPARGDDEENVLENWRRFGAAVGAPTEKLVHGVQVHGNTVRVAAREDAHGILEKAAWAGTDGYVTNVPGLPLVIFTADCAPLLMQDEAAGVIAAIHCGWRSTACDIEKAAVDAMVQLGARPGNIHAAVGPCIGPCCFETGEEVPEALDALLGGDSAELFERKENTPGKFYVDLPKTVARRLVQLGVGPDNIVVSGLCTVDHPELFWSNRASGDRRGSQANLIML